MININKVTLENVEVTLEQVGLINSLIRQYIRAISDKFRDLNEVANPPAEQEPNFIHLHNIVSRLNSAK